MSVSNMIFGYLKAMTAPCLVSLPIIVLTRLIIYKRTKAFNCKREVLIIIFWVSLTAVLSQTILPDSVLRFDFSHFPYHLPQKSDHLINTAPIHEWAFWMLYQKNYAEFVKNIVGNIVLFIPYGSLMPAIWKKLKAKTILFGFLLSCFIEFIQLFMDRQTDIYDVLLNTFGIIVGYIIFLILKRKTSRSEI